jgi:hypothetical protein
MQLSLKSAARLELTRRSSARAPLFTAVGFALMALLPLCGPGPVTLARTLFGAALSLVAAALFAYAWPRVHTVGIALDSGTLELEGRTVPLARARALALASGGATREGALRVRYRVELLLDDAERVVLLERSDPARVLADLRELLRHLSLPVQTGWGLPEHAEPWRDEGRIDSPPRSGAEHTRPYEGELGAGIMVLGGFGVIGGAMTIMHSARIEHALPTSFESYALSSITGTLVLALALFLLTDRAEASVDDKELTLERRAFGLRLARRRIPLGDVRGVYSVGPADGNPLHLLVDAKAGPIAWPFAGPGADAFMRRFARSEG